MPPAKTKQTPSEEFQDAVSSAVSSLLKVANHAFQTTQEEGREEARKAAARVEEMARQRDELRNERDALLQDKHAFHVELESTKCDAAKWRTRAEKAEWIVNQQSENVSELRETIKEIRDSFKESQAEAQQWKAKFMRADEERYALSVTNSDLVSRQLYASSVANAYQTPPTPRSQDPSSIRGVSLGTYINATGSGNGYLTDGELSRRHAQGGSSHANAERRKSRQSNAQVSQQQQPTTTSRVVRRVHVVMENGGGSRDNTVRVKQEREEGASMPLSTPLLSRPLSPSLGEESTDEMVIGTEPDASTPRAAQTTKGKGKRVSNATIKTNKAPRASASGTTNGRRSHSQQSRGRSQSRARKSASHRDVERMEDYSNESEYEEEPDFDQMDQQTRGRVAVKKGKQRVKSNSNSLGLFDDEVETNNGAAEEEDEEDELMLGSGHVSHKRAHSQTHARSSASISKKRGSPYPSNASSTIVVGNGSNKRPRKR